MHSHNAEKTTTGVCVDLELCCRSASFHARRIIIAVFSIEIGVRKVTNADSQRVCFRETRQVHHLQQATVDAGKQLFKDFQ